MKVSYLIPDNQYSFFQQSVSLLQQTDIVLEVNRISPDTDLILMGILPCTPKWIETIEASRKPYVAWHWDLYSFVDFSQHRWKWFLDCLPRAADVWSCTYETARQLKEVTGVDSYVMPAWVNSADLRELPPQDYVLYAASSCALGKRVDWAEATCKLCGYDLQLLRHQKIPPLKYFETVGRCRVYLMSAFEESNATIPAQEAGACNKAVVLADIPASREVFGNTAYYFPVADFGALRRALTEAWENGPKPGVRERILNNYDLPVVFSRMLERLHYVLSRV